MDRLFPILWIAIAWIAHVQGGHDTSVCSPFVPGSVRVGPPKPTLPKAFTARVECNILDQNRTTDVIEYYDFPNQRGAVYQTEHAVTGRIIYDYDTNEIFTVDPSSPKPCFADELTEDNNDFLFGYKHTNHSTRMFSPSAALRFGGKNVEKYLDRSVVRGIVVEGWESCTYWPDLDATSRVKWYFTDASEWTEATGGERLPVRCEIVGKSHDSDGGSRSYHHIYEFTHFRPNIEKKVGIFETPRGMFCENRKSIKAMGMSPQFFHFEVEVVVPGEKILSYIAEWYDYSTSLVRFDYSPFPSDSQGLGLGVITEIHDFNTGVRYITNRQFGNCTAKVIDPAGFDAYDINPQTVRLRSPSQFFDFDGTFQYEGTHHANEVDCDGWVSTVKNIPQFNNSKVEWLLTTKDWVISTGNIYQDAIPRRLEIRGTDADGPYVQYVYNVYNYESSKPAVWDYDISNCFHDDHRRHFQFELQASFRSVMLKVFRDKFEYAVYGAIATQAAISPVRIHKMQVDYNEDGIQITFTMLDVAPIAGDAQKGATETPLDVAANNLINKIQSGQFVVTVPHQPKPLKLTAKPESAKKLKVREWLNNPIPLPSSGYRPGDMAAVALVMLIVGLVAGCGVVIMIYRKNGGSFFPNPKQNEGFGPPTEEPK